MIQVEELKKSYGTIEALKGISFSVGEGEIVGLLGPNGAGKTTTIKTLTGYLHPDEGDVHIDGLDVLEQPREVQSRIGYLSENTPLYPELSVQSYLKLMADLRGVPSRLQREYVSEALYATGLVDRRARPIGELSKGLRQRVGLAQAILHRPRLLILDEPTIGLDPTQIVEMRSLIRRLAEHTTVLFSSHILPEVEALCDRVVIIINGEIKADSNLADLAATDEITLVLQTEADGIAEQLHALGDVDAVEPYTTRDGYPAYHLTSSADLLPAIYDMARREDWPLRELRRDEQTLESVFNQLATTA